VVLEAVGNGNAIIPRCEKVFLGLPGQRKQSFFGFGMRLDPAIAKDVGHLDASLG
jgi:hypothetical protein